MGNILCDFDHALLPRVWNAPWPDFREVASLALAERLTPLRGLAGPVHPDGWLARASRGGLGMIPARRALLTGNSIGAQPPQDGEVS